MNLSYYKGAVLLAVGVLVWLLVMIGCEPTRQSHGVPLRQGQSTGVADSSAAVDGADHK